MSSQFMVDLQLVVKSINDTITNKVTQTGHNLP